MRSNNKIPPIKAARIPNVQYSLRENAPIDKPSISKIPVATRGIEVCGCNSRLPFFLLDVEIISNFLNMQYKYGYNISSFGWLGDFFYWS